MTDLGTQLERLGLEQYVDVFVGEGFDIWETLLDIQESDFDALNVKLGHRRKLQRAIADYRGIPYERLVSASPYESSFDGPKGVEGAQPPSTGNVSGTGGGAETKRKYRRHPKPDENAPERPPSAYVIFSNKVREEVKEQNLTFTQIAKLVGDRWQKLDSFGKEPYEAQANAAKERYNIQLSTYKKTDAYKDYAQYLADFKVKHGGTSESKRPRLDQESSGGSVSLKSQGSASEMLAPTQGHARGGSTGLVGSTTYRPAIPSPSSLQGPPLPTSTSQSSTPHVQRGLIATSRADSPSAQQIGDYTRRFEQFSNQSSLSDDSSTVRSEQDTIGRTASLSLSTPPSATPPLHPYQSNPQLDYGSGLDSSQPRFPGISLHMASSGFGPQSGANLSPASPFGQSLPSPATSEAPLRGRVIDLRGYGERGRAIQPHLLLNTTPPPVTTISLPPLIGPERFPDISSRRMLPLPRTSPTVKPGFVQGARHADSPSSYQSTPVQRPQPGHGGTPTLLDRSESDAADALAGLAAGGPRPKRAKPSDSKWKHR